MLETPHIVVAAAIATKTEDPYLALTLALVSHFVLDRLPHWNPHLTTKKGGAKKILPNSFRLVIADSTLALVAGSAIALNQLPNINKVILIFLCCFIAVLPDLIEAPYIFLNYKNELLKKWVFFQKRIQVNSGFVWGISTQLLIVASSILWIVQK